MAAGGQPRHSPAGSTISERYLTGTPEADGDDLSTQEADTIIEQGYILPPAHPAVEAHSLI